MSAPTSLTFLIWLLEFVLIEHRQWKIPRNTAASWRKDESVSPTKTAYSLITQILFSNWNQFDSHESFYFILLIYLYWFTTSVHSLIVTFWLVSLIIWWENEKTYVLYVNHIYNFERVVKSQNKHSKLQLSEVVISGFYCDYHTWSTVLWKILTCTEILSSTVAWQFNTHVNQPTFNPEPKNNLQLVAS